MSAVLTFDPALFRIQLPAFSDSTTYPDPILQTYWDVGTNFISADNYGALSGDSRQYALNLMVAHLATIQNLLNAGKTPRIANSAGVDKINVTLTPPPVNNDMWAWWLATTPYGVQLYSLLQVSIIGGLFIGGTPEIGSIRKAAGIF